MLKREYWTLNKLVALALIGGFALMMLEIRFEHREVIAEEQAAWIPIVFSGLALATGLAALALWDHGGRMVLSVVFAAALVVGTLGVWFHTDGKPLAALSVVAQSAQLLVSGSTASQVPDTAAEKPEYGESSEHDLAASLPQTVNAEMAKLEAPESIPLLAPLAFCGLGIIGLLACSSRLSAVRPASEAPA